MGVILWQKDWVEITSVIKPGGSRRHSRSISWVARITVAWQQRYRELYILHGTWNNPVSTCSNTYYSPNKWHFSQQFKELFFSSGCQTWKTKGRKGPEKLKRRETSDAVHDPGSAFLIQAEITQWPRWHGETDEWIQEQGFQGCHGNIWTAEQQPRTTIIYLFLTYIGLHIHVWNFTGKRGISEFAKGKELLSFTASSNQNSYLKTKPLGSVKQAPRPKEGTGTFVTMSALFDALGGDSGKGDGQREGQKFHHSTKVQIREATDDKHWKSPWVALKAGMKSGWHRCFIATKNTFPVLPAHQ